MSLQIKNKRLSWIGHVVRMGNNRIPKQTINWKPFDKGDMESQKGHGKGP